MSFNKGMILMIAFLGIIFFLPTAFADNSCITCHEKLTVFNETEKQFNEIRLKHLARDVACSIDCHVQTLDKFAKSNYEQWTRSKHALFNITCDTCHGGNPASDIKETAHMGILRSSDSNSPVFYRNVPETCGKCHRDELNEFKNSKHYEKLKALKQAPTCDTCHRSHEFTVLNISEFHGLCRNCHNPTMRIAPSDAPDKAILALEEAEILKSDIILAENAVKGAEQEGKDVSVAKADLEKAASIRDSLPVLWHGFDLSSFENIISSGIDAARKARQESGEPMATPSTPSFGALLSILGILVIYGMRKRL